MSPASEFRPPARFRILRRVGAGGMGVVYEAIDQNSGGRVALKALKAVAPHALLAFKEEFRALTGFSHPNVATLYELLSAGDQWFISMEFIEGLSFLDYLCAPQPDRTAAAAGAGQSDDEATLTLPKSDPNVDPALAGSRRRPRAAPAPLKLRETMRQLARAVMALHAEGILHRDLKPSNVMITPEGRLFVLDFGVAARLNQFGESSQHTHFSGTAAYMAPEQAAGEALSPAADWYAMGVMLYEALSGKRPFEGTVHALLRDKQKLEAPALEADIVERDDEVAKLCMALLRREPARRPRGAEVIARLGGSSVSAFPPKRAAFVGRESQLAALRSAFAGAAHGATKVALIVGKSGMGKSALAGRFLAELESRDDALVLSGRCYESESLPFKAFDSIVDSLARYLMERTTAEVNRVLPRGLSALSQVFPVLNQVAAMGAATERHPPREARELRQRAFGALRDLLIRLGDLRRLVIYIDDAQWGDSDSAALLRHIVQEPDAPEMLLVAACREEHAEQSELLSALSAHPGCVRVPVGPLTGEEARRLAAELYGAGDERAERIARESGGSPYFMQELRETSEDSETRVVSLDAVLHGRVTALADGAKRLVEIAAV
ncbi:MAG TPA: serine/threonine-protein kinase, partial [Bryobacteraceae bacterium]|nr:serine/threonine-protein kinase [Bryobacteraceae bacterium]